MADDCPGSDRPPAPPKDPHADAGDQTEAIVSGSARSTAGLPRKTEPRLIGDFRIVTLIGAGGMGVVYEAEQQHAKRPVALKVIRGDRYVDETAVRLFRREAQVLARLKHPAIAAIYESGRTDDGEHFFAMELVRGKTLDDWLSGRPPTDESTPAELDLRLRVFRKICEGVAYAHQRGVIHRDLKPSNILILHEQASGSGHSAGDTPDVKILDFGLARITDTDVAASTMVTDAGTVRGTLSYMSPEQIRGNTDEIDMRTDIYSLGMVLYQMLTGDLPYEITGKPMHEISRMICEETPKSLVSAWKGGTRPDRDLETITFKGVRVRCFGMVEYKPAHEKMYPQVVILDYNGPRDFVIELKTKSPGERVILAKVAPGKTLQQTVRRVNARAERAKAVKMVSGDVLKIPRMNFDLSREYSELYGRALRLKNRAFAGYVIVQAVQDIRFQMDEKGLKLRSESRIIGCDAPGLPPPRHVMIFDEPFLLMLQRAGAKAPYFALWVDNAELLCKWEE